MPETNFPLPKGFRVLALERVTSMPGWTECLSRVGLIILRRNAAIVSTTDFAILGTRQCHVAVCEDFSFYRGDVSI